MPINQKWFTHGPPLQTTQHQTTCLHHRLTHYGRQFLKPKTTILVWVYQRFVILFFFWSLPHIAYWQTCNYEHNVLICVQPWDLLLGCFNRRRDCGGVTAVSTKHAWPLASLYRPVKSYIWLLGFWFEDLHIPALIVAAVSSSYYSSVRTTSWH